MSDSINKESLSYTLGLFANVLDWYKRAEFKAQLLLTLNGVFASFITTAVIRFPEVIVKLPTNDSGLIIIILTVLCVLLALSIVCALLCLWSRTYSQKQIDAIFRSEKIKETAAETYTPRVMHFFQIISFLEADAFSQKLKEMDSSFALEALGLDIYYLSINTREKHRWVNWGFVFAGSALIVMLVFSLSYLSLAPLV